MRLYVSVHGAPRAGGRAAGRWVSQTNDVGGSSRGLSPSPLPLTSADSHERVLRVRGDIYPSLLASFPRVRAGAPWRGPKGRVPARPRDPCMHRLCRHPERLRSNDCRGLVRHGRTKRLMLKCHADRKPAIKYDDAVLNMSEQRFVVQMAGLAKRSLKVESCFGRIYAHALHGHMGRMRRVKGSRPTRAIVYGCAGDHLAPSSSRSLSPENYYCDDGRC
jgi:hypothetical protein